MMIILTLLSETSKRSFEIDRCNSEINREPIYTLFIFFFQFSGSKYNYSAAHLGSPRGIPVAEHWSRPVGTPNASHTFGASTDSGRKRDYVGTVKDNVVLGPTLFFVHDPETRIQFLVDTGSEYSLLPCKRSAADPSRTQWLVAATGSRVPAFESITLTVKVGLHSGGWC